MARSKHLMSHFLSNNTLEFIGKSFTFSAIGQAIEKDVFSTRLDHDIRYMIEKTTLSRWRSWRLFLAAIEWV